MPPARHWINLVFFLVTVPELGASSSSAEPSSSGSPSFLKKLPPLHEKSQGKAHETPEQDGRRLKHKNSHSLLQVNALYHGYGTYYVDMWIGTPPQRQTLIVDMGDSVTSFPCRSCHNCGNGTYHIDQVFDEERSLSFEKIQCDVNNDTSCQSQYGKCHINDQSSGSSSGSCRVSIAEDTNGFEARDIGYLGGMHNMPLLLSTSADNLFDGDAWDPHDAALGQVPNFLFTCLTYAGGLFRRQLADGVLGMNAGRDAFWQQWHRHNQTNRPRQFSLCLARPPADHVDKNGTLAGGLTLGGTDPQWHTKPMQYAKMVIDKRTSSFRVKLRKIWLDHWYEHKRTTKPVPVNADEVLNHHGAGVVVDSGVTDTFFDKRLFPAFNETFFELTGQSYSFGHSSVWSLTTKELEALPTIEFQIEHLSGDAVVRFPPTHYMELVVDNPTPSATTTSGESPSNGSSSEDERRNYRARFYIDENERNQNVLGANFLMGHDVLFDYDNQLIGFAESSCNYTRYATRDVLMKADPQQTQQPAQS